MSQYKELLAQKAALDAQIAAAKKAEFSGAVAQARALVKEHGLTPEDVFAPVKGAKGAKGGSSARGSKVAAKYRDPVSGAEWTGRGKAPAWIKDKDRDAFLIAA